MSQLVLSGHSFGGGTMIKVASMLKDADQPKALLLMDPWNYSIHDDISNGTVKFKCPVQMIHSESFHGMMPLKHFDSWGSV